MKTALMNYTIQCTDQVSGRVGCFLFDLKKFEETGKFYAVCPVYSDLVEFFQNTRPEDRCGIYTEHNPAPTVEPLRRPQAQLFPEAAAEARILRGGC